MMSRRRALAHQLPSFGRRAPARVPLAPRSPGALLSDDLRLFALTFAGGFLFMSVYLA